MNKEQIYDAEINPLMAKIIEICKAHGIAMLATFATPTEEEADLCCTTILGDENGVNPKRHLVAYSAISGEQQRMAVTEEKPDGTKRVTVFLG